MPAPLLTTKLYLPPLRLRSVPRPRLVERLNDGLAAGNRLTLVSAPAGFGKTTLVGEWVAGCGRPVAWLSLDEGDSDPGRFLAYLVAALQTVAPGIGDGVLAVLGSPQPPPLEAMLTLLLNELATIPSDVVLVLDDYHVLDARPVDDALAFLVEHLPPQVHLVIATREDPALPLARLRARGQLTELRAADLRFTPSEAAAFLNQVMDLDLSADEIAALDARTEGWIAGLQLAAISLQGRDDAAGFIRSFAGSHRFVLDYLLEEVLQRQPDSVQAFLLRTSILDRLCGPLCDAVLLDASATGQATLEHLERANLFLVPLDNERRWYRYHHLFADLLRQRRQQTTLSSGGVDDDHLRASEWYEANGLEIEAFQHAAAGHDVERAERLIEGRGMPLHFRGALVPILHWLESLPTTVFDARPSLWVTYASVLLSSGQKTGVEPKLQAAERALQDARTDDRTRDLVGRIASVRAFLVWGPHRGRDDHRPVAPCPGVSAPRQPPVPHRRCPHAGQRLCAPGRPLRGAASPHGSDSDQRGIGEHDLRDPGVDRSGRPSRKQTTSSVWRSRPIGTPLSWQPVCRFPSSAKPTWAWPVCTTSGTTSTPPDSTGSRVSSWHGR